jgi:hypothetical protein
MDAFVAPIVVAVGGALMWFAYQHPRDYGKLVWWLMLIGGLFVLGGAVWAFSNGAADKAVMEVPALTVAQIDQLAAAMNAVSLPWWWFPAIGAGYVYLGFLASFPAWISDVGARYGSSQPDPKKE